MVNAELPADIVAVEFDAPLGNIYQRGDLLGCFSFPHQTGHLDLRRSEVQEAVGEAVEER